MVHSETGNLERIEIQPIQGHSEQAFIKQVEEFYLFYTEETLENFEHNSICPELFCQKRNLTVICGKVLHHRNQSWSNRFRQ